MSTNSLYIIVFLVFHRPRDIVLPKVSNDEIIGDHQWLTNISTNNNQTVIIEENSPKLYLIVVQYK